MSLFQKIAILLVILMFLLTRLYRITEIPGSLYWDEASISYNAYSILQSGRDEWGEFLPLHFRAFGEFKLPLYIYSTALSIFLFGLEDFAVRIPAVFFSLGTIVLTYLLGKKLFNQTTGIASAFILATLPWFFLFTRTGFEATAGLMFFLLGIYLFLFLDRSKIFLLLSTLSFILSCYSYNSFRIISPIILLFLIIMKNNFLLRKPKTTIPILFIGLFLIILSIIPIYKLMRYDYGGNRLEAIGVFHNSLSLFEVGSQIASNYISHLNPNFLFLKGDKNLRHHTGYSGQMFLSVLPFLLVGFYLILKKKTTNLIILFALAISLIPAAITRESPHALRAIAAVPFISIIAGVGMQWLLERKKLIARVLIAMILIQFGFYFLDFVSNYNNNSSKDWMYGYRGIFLKAKTFEGYDNIYIADTYAQPYIFALYYLKYDPLKYLLEVDYNPVSEWGVSKVRSFDKYIFYTKDENFKNNSLVFSDQSLKDLQEVDAIKNHDGSVAFYVYETR